MAGAHHDRFARVQELLSRVLADLFPHPAPLGAPPAPRPPPGFSPHAGPRGRAPGGFFSPRAPLPPGGGGSPPPPRPPPPRPPRRRRPPPPPPGSNHRRTPPAA